MIEVKIPKEIKSYKAKIVGPFNGRQCICLLIGIPVLFFLWNTIPDWGDLKIIICMLALLPLVLIGWAKFYGMEFEKFAVNYVKYNVLAPSIRKYKTENYYDLLNKQIKKEQEFTINKKGKKVKIKKPKYKKSKEAIK